MSKIASYLQEHISGEVTTNPAILQTMSHDASVLEMTPEMVIYPRSTSDVRKIARFAWQLAEKGHILPLTPRGSGTDQTGGAIGAGITIVLPAHMNQIFEFDAKQKLVRVQPGANARGVNDALMLHGVAVPALPPSAAYSTIGGAVANNASGVRSGRYGTMQNWVAQLEVVLANGEVLQTGRLSRRELHKRKGLQTLEGEIYRSLDNLIEDNKQLIAEKIASEVPDTIGYSAISQVKQKDGSFDLTPLFVGSQGTLGIISELIVKSDYLSASMAVALLAFSDSDTARDVLDQLDELQPARLDYYDGDLFTLASTNGKKYDFYKGIKGKLSSVILIGFDDFSERARLKKLKKVQKLVDKNDTISMEAADGDSAADLLAIEEVTSYASLISNTGASAPPLLHGAYVPRHRFEEFGSAVWNLAAKYHVALPLHSRMNENTHFIQPILYLHKVGDKQKVFKLLDEYSNIVASHDGHLIGVAAEGRVKARFAQKQLDDDILELFGNIKSLFDPYGILNPGVKQAAEVRQLVSHLRTQYTNAETASYIPYN